MAACKACAAAPGGICARRCGATSKRTGERCGQHNAPGAVVCKWHGGSASQVVAKAEQRAEQLEISAELDKLGVALDVDPGDALLLMVCEAAGNVAYLRARVQALHPLEIYGLIDEAEGKRKAEPHVLVRMYDAERDRLAACAALAIRANVDERRVRMAEATTDRLFTAVTTALTAAGLTPEQQETFRLALAAALRLT